VSRRSGTLADLHKELVVQRPALKAAPTPTSSFKTMDAVHRDIKQGKTSLKKTHSVMQLLQQRPEGTGTVLLAGWLEKKSGMMYRKRWISLEQFAQPFPFLIFAQVEGAQPLGHLALTDHTTLRVEDGKASLVMHVALADQVMHLKIPTDQAAPWLDLIRQHVAPAPSTE